MAALALIAGVATGRADPLSPSTTPPAHQPVLAPGPPPAPPPPVLGPPLPPTLAALEREVAARPDDVDLRLRFATALARADLHDDARREALEVLVRAPSYLDADLLVARLDAWNRRWPAARSRLARILAARPDDLDARLLAVDVALWSGDVAGAERGLAAIRPAEIGEVAHWYRQAQAALARRDHRRALALARRILAVDPTHAGARGLRASVSRISLESATDAEVYPGTYRQRVALGETLTVTAFPRSRWSVTLAYEYRRRFGTDNHRFAARGDWRLNNRWTLLGFVRGGRVEVVPTATALVEARWERRGWLLGGRYTYDRMSWSGDLHRAQAIAGAAPTRRVRVEGEAMIGTLSGCDVVTAVWAARLRATWSPAPWDLSAVLGRGLEADRALASADPCGGGSIELVDQDVQAFGLDVTRAIGSVSVRVSYGLEQHGDHALVHVVGLALRTWF